MRNLCLYCWLMIPLEDYTRPGEGKHRDGHKCMADVGAKMPFDDLFHDIGYSNFNYVVSFTTKSSHA